MKGMLLLNISHFSAKYIIWVTVLFSGANSSLLVKPVCPLSSLSTRSSCSLLLGLEREFQAFSSHMTHHHGDFLVTIVVPCIDLNGKTELSPSNIEVNVVVTSATSSKATSQPLVWDSSPPIRTIARKRDSRAGQREADKREARSSVWNPTQVYSMAAICMCLCYN